MQYHISGNEASGIHGEGNTFRLQPVDTETVILTITDIKETSSVGSDGIPMKFIKDALCIKPSYITCTIYTSIVTGVFPKENHNFECVIFRKPSTALATRFSQVNALNSIKIVFGLTAT